MKSIIWLLLYFTILSCSKSKTEAEPEIHEIESTDAKINILQKVSNQDSPKELFLITKGIDFQSESDQDNFYLRYSDSLKIINGDKDFILREKLIKSFRAINELHARLNYGGTFYGHQYKRLLAEVEYSIYKKEGQTVSKDIFLSNKKNYINNWIQHIEKMESKNVYNQMDEISAKRRASELDQILDQIQTSINSQFVLDQVINFENLYYK